MAIIIPPPPNTADVLEGTKISKSWLNFFDKIWRTAKSGLSWDGLIDSTTSTAPAAGEARLNWDDTNKRIQATDSTPTTFNFGLIDRGDPSAYDFAKADLTLDDNWHDMDLSSIVPVGAKAVLIRTAINHTTALSGVQYRKNGNANVINVSDAITTVASSANYVTGIVACDVNRIIEYRTQNGAPAPTDIILIVISGWFI